MNRHAPASPSFVLPPHVTALVSTDGKTRTTDPWKWTPDDSAEETRMDVEYDEESPQRMRKNLDGRKFDMFRYRELLPLPDDAAPMPLDVGWTPLTPAPRLAASVDVKAVYLKDDGRNPSGSLKDRPSALGVVLAVATGADRIVCASTGNAASSTACAAAAVGLRATIFVPQRAPAPKVAQLKIFGAEVLRVRADYDATWDLCAALAAQKPWFNRNCAHNPYLVEGKKTVALEIAEQLGDAMTEWVALSVGDGCTIAGVCKGLDEAHRAGLIPFVPRVLGVQAEGAAPLVTAFENGHRGEGPLQMVHANSVADSIAVGHPRNWRKALKSVGANGGTYIAVSDDEILQAMRDTARLGGIFAEPAAAAATAGVRRARADGVLAASDRVTVIVSGNGLKDTATALVAAGDPIEVDPTLEAVSAALRD